MLTVLIADETFERDFGFGFPEDGLITVGHQQVHFILASDQASALQFYRNWLGSAQTDDYLIVSADVGAALDDKLRASMFYASWEPKRKHDRIFKAAHSIDEPQENRVQFIPGEHIIPVDVYQWLALIEFCAHGHVLQINVPALKNKPLIGLINQLTGFNLFNELLKRKSQSARILPNLMSLDKAVQLSRDVTNLSEGELLRTISARLDLSELQGGSVGILKSMSHMPVQFSLYSGGDVKGQIVNSISKAQEILQRTPFASLVLSLQNYEPDLLNILPRLKALLYSGNQSRHLLAMCQQYGVAVLSRPHMPFAFKDGTEVELRRNTLPPMQSALLNRLEELHNGLIDKPEIYINGENDAVFAGNHGFAGIGLIRSEHLLIAEQELRQVRVCLNHGDEEDFFLLPSQYTRRYKKNYQNAALYNYAMPLVIRLSDFILPEIIAANDPSPILQELRASNPRGRDFTERYPDFYPMQLRAIRDAYLKTATKGGTLANPHILIPMVRDAAEMQEHRATVRDIFGETPFKLGAMIETLGALQNLEALARASDFLSIGSNDLTEQLLGLTFQDARATEKWMTANRTPYNPFLVMADPVLDAVRDIVKRARIANPDITIGLCGGQAADLQSFIKLLPLGLDYISVPQSAALHCAIARGQWIERRVQNLPGMCYQAPILGM